MSRVLPATQTAEELLRRQNGDGGWGYKPPSSRTEPTALASAALTNHGVLPQRSMEWLVRRQRSDGGWAPGDVVDQSTWVTSLVLLVPGLPATSHKRGLEWLLNLTSRESSRVERLRRFLVGSRLEAGEGTTGWPFFPGTAGWVTPTSMAIVALRAAATLYPNDARIRDRIDAGHQFLLARACPDGGWNHGSSRSLGYDLSSYPETTGQALLALRGQASPVVSKAVLCAERHLARAESVEATVWLRLGLMAHGRSMINTCPPARGTLDLILRLILERAEEGANVFV